MTVPAGGGPINSPKPYTRLSKTMQDIILNERKDAVQLLICGSNGLGFRVLSLKLLGLSRGCICEVWIFHLFI